MGEYTPNIKLYKPSIGEIGWGDLVNNNFDVLDEQIDGIKKELITMAVKILMNQAVAHATSKDFYSIIADVITPDYPKGFKNTFEYVSSPAEYEITIDNSNNPNDLTDYQILLEINNDEQFFEDCLYDPKFLEFYDEDKTTLLSHYVEEWDTENYNAKIWIKVPSIPANSTKNIYLKVNKGRTEDLSNRETVFDFWDDFDTEKPEWTLSYATIDTANSRLDIHPGSVGSDIERGAWLNKDLPSGRVVEFKASFSGKGQNPRPVWSVNWIDSSNYYAIAEKGLYSPGGSEVRVVIGGSSSTFGFTSNSLSENVDYIFRVAWSKPNGNVKYWVNDDLLADVTDDSLKRLDASGLALTAKDLNHIYVDWIRVRKYTDPEPTITYTRNVIPVDYVTVTFDFPEGVDKLLVTTDSDAQNVYYSTDDGNTWNPIERDTETELPETAYSIKLKFEQATYMRGYAFLTW